MEIYIVELREHRETICLLYISNTKDGAINWMRTGFDKFHGSEYLALMKGIINSEDIEVIGYYDCDGNELNEQPN